VGDRDDGAGVLLSCRSSQATDSEVSRVIRRLVETEEDRAFAGAIGKARAAGSPPGKLRDVRIPQAANRKASMAICERVIEIPGVRRAIVPGNSACSSRQLRIS